MSGRTSIVRGSVRAATGLVITGIAATAAIVLGTGDSFQVERPPLALTVDTQQGGEQRLVCAGPFGELGADPSQPDVSIPVGTVDVAFAAADGVTAGEQTLHPNNGSTDGGKTFTGATGETMGAAQYTAVKTATIAGAAASTCVSPANSQWLIGGSSTLGVSTTVTIGNPSDVIATVHLAVFDENGRIDASESAGVIVPAGGQQTVSLNGFAPDRERLAVQVTSTGAPVTASLGVAHIVNLTPFAISSGTRQLRPAMTSVIPAVMHRDVSGRENRASDAGDGDEVPVTVRVIAADGAEGVARVRAVDAAGSITELGTINLAADTVGDLVVAKWPKQANAVIVEADVPVYSAARAAARMLGSQDYEWFSAAPVINADSEVAVPVVKGGQLVVTNPGTTTAEVSVRATGGATANVKVPAGAAVPIALSGASVLSTNAPVYAAVRVVGDNRMAGYPIVPEIDRDGELTVYLR